MILGKFMGFPFLFFPLWIGSFFSKMPVFLEQIPPTFLSTDEDMCTKSKQQKEPSRPFCRMASVWPGVATLMAMAFACFLLVFIFFLFFWHGIGGCFCWMFNKNKLFERFVCRFIPWAFTILSLLNPRQELRRRGQKRVAKT